MKRIVLWSALICALLVCQAPPTNAQVAPKNGGSTVAAAQLVSYDDFRGPRINPNKWTGIWGDFSDMRERTREDDGNAVGPDRALRDSMRSYVSSMRIVPLMKPSVLHSDKRRLAFAPRIHPTCTARRCFVGGDGRPRPPAPFSRVSSGGSPTLERPEADRRRPLR
jgi:hypothetical protein